VRLDRVQAVRQYEIAERVIAVQLHERDPRRWEQIEPGLKLAHGELLEGESLQQFATGEEKPIGECVLLAEQLILESTPDARAALTVGRDRDDSWRGVASEKKCARLHLVSGRGVG
jgi:hypothetical protein